MPLRHLSFAAGRGVCGPPGRVAQPRLFANIEGTPQGRQTGVAFRSKQGAQRATMFLGEDPCGLAAGLPPARTLAGKRLANNKCDFLTALVLKFHLDNLPIVHTMYS